MERECENCGRQAVGDAEFCGRCAELFRVHALKEEVSVKERKFLIAQGWKYTSQTPGSLWLFERKLSDGRVILVSQDTAMFIEEQGAAD